MRPLAPTPWESPVFAAGSRIVTVGDVIDAARFRGELEPCWQRLLELVESEARAAQLECLDLAGVQAKSERWRGERDLIAAEETEAWLQRRGLTLEEFSDYFHRHAAREALVHRSDPPQIERDDPVPDLRELLRAELLLSGDFDALAIRLSWRFAARQAAHGESMLDLVEEERARFQLRASLPDLFLPEWLTCLAGNRSWLDEMATLEAAYRHQGESLLTPAARARMLTAQHLPLMRLQLEVMELESRDAAREAFLCVCEDGIPLAQVAEDGRYSYRPFDAFYEDLPEDLQRIFLCAAAEEVVEPIERADGFQLWRLRQKMEPDLADSAVRDRVDRRILERHFSELATSCIRWMMPCGTTYVAAIR